MDPRVRVIVGQLSESGHAWWQDELVVDGFHWTVTWRRDDRAVNRGEDK